MSEMLDLASGRYLNESSIRDHALECSQKFRAGRFTRVGKDFLDEVRADVEAKIRHMRSEGNTSPHAPLENDGKKVFTTGALADKVMCEWNEYIGRLIQQKVQRQPSVGVTLSRTR